MSSARAPDTAGPINEAASGGHADRSGRFLAHTSKIVCAAVTLVGATWLIVLLATRQPVRVHWTLQVLLAVIAILSSVLVERQRRRHWDQPFQQLRKLLPEIRGGAAPIDELTRIKGEMEPIIPILREILRDNRQRKAEIAQLNEEMSQRVAHRTDALERQVGSLRQQATRDGLTGLHNRRMLDQQLPELLEKCRAAKQNLALLMTDIDHFKHLNDTLGHAAGDDLLKTFGQIARSSLRDGDLAFRCGGDEFVILLVDCDLKTSAAIVERLISMTDAYTQNLHVSPKPRLSIGMSLLSELPSATAEMLLQAADKTLYDMKSIRKQAMIARSDDASGRATA